MAVDAEVARLEGELAEVRETLSHANEAYESTKAAIRAKDATLREIVAADPDDPDFEVGCDYEEWSNRGDIYCYGKDVARREAADKARAALSPDAGKGSRVPYGQETRAVWGKDGKPCHDCAVRVGGLHQPGCDVEECPVCHLQLITCVCDDATLDALKGVE